MAELLNKAQMVLGPEALEGKVQCLVSNGTGIPSLRPFRDDVFHVGETLVAMVTEQMMERLRR